MPSEKVSKESKAKIQDGQQTDAGTVILNFKNLGSLSGIMMQMNIVSTTYFFSFLSLSLRVFRNGTKYYPYSQVYRIALHERSNQCVTRDYIIKKYLKR